MRHVFLRVMLAVMLAILMPAPQAVATDSERGATIARAGTATGVPPCMSCHGPRGMGQGPAGYPRIAGLDAGYIARQLLAFRDGTRENPVMDALIKSLTDQDIKDLSQLTNLKSLDLRDTAITNAGFAELRKTLRDCQILQ